MANEFEKAAATGCNDSPVLVAPPIFLGDLRKALGGATLQRGWAGSPHKDIAKASLPPIHPPLE